MISLNYIIILFVLFFKTENLNYSEKIPDSNLCIEMIYIPGGEFKMDTENTNSETRVSSFWISKYEITWEIYNLFMEYEENNKLEFIVGNEKIMVDGISKPTTPYTDMTFGMGNEGFPAVNMTHFAASKFCKWLSFQTGNYYRLPTEAEWEYVSRSQINDDMDEIDNYAWHKYNSGDKYQKVGQKKPNKWGIYDMFGNVSEWVADSYDENIFKSKQLRSDPFIFNESKYPKVYKGGSWNDKPDVLLPHKRFYSTSRLQERDPQIPKSKWWNTDAPHIGFRIVRVENVDSKPLRDLFWNN